MAALSTLTDNFDDNSRDAAKWNLDQAEGSGQGSTTVSETNQQLELLMDKNTVGYDGYGSVNTYNLTADRCYVRVLGVPASGNTFAEMFFKLTADRTQGSVAMWVNQGNMLASTWTGGSRTDLVFPTYSSSTHAWWSIRESGGTIFFDTAPSTASNPPVSGDWVNLTSATTPSDFAVTATKAYLFAGVWNSSSGTAAGTGIFDGFNTGTAAAAGTAVTPGVGSLALATFAPTISQPHAVAPSVNALTLATFAPTVAQPHAVAPGVGALTLATFAPSIAQPHGVSPGVVALTLATFAPTVAQAGTGTNVLPDVCALALATFAPTLAQTANQALTPAAGALTLATFTPSILQPQSAAPGTTALSLASFAPTLAQTANQGVAPGAAALVLTTYAPTVQIAAGSQGVTPGVMALTLTGYAPTVQQSAATDSPSGGYSWFPQQRIKTEKEKRAERIELGILPPDVIEVLPPRLKTRKSVSMAELIGIAEAPESSISLIDLEVIFQKAKRKQRQAEDELLMLLD